MAKTKAELLADLTTYFNDNASGDIVPARHRTQQSEVIDALALAADTLATFQFSVYGGMSYSGAPQAWPDIGATWQTIDDANTLMIDPPLHVVVNPINGSLAFDYAGVYEVAVIGSFEHNSDNSGRTTGIRLYDMTAGGPGSGGMQIGVGRNVEVTAFSATLQFEITAGEVGHEWVAQIGGGDTLTNVNLDSFGLSTKSIGPFMGLLGDA